MKEAIIIFVVAMCLTSLTNGLNLFGGAPQGSAPLSQQSTAAPSSGDMSSDSQQKSMDAVVPGSKVGAQSNRSQL